MRRRVMDLGFFLTLAAALSGNFGIGPGFALADDASRRKAAPAIGANPSSPESIEAGVVTGPWRTPPDLEKSARWRRRDRRRHRLIGPSQGTSIA